MTETVAQEALEPLDVFVGEWAMTASFASGPSGEPRAARPSSG